MKKIIAYSFNLLFLVTFLASCLGDLDTMPLDNNQLVSDQVYKTKDGYTGVLAKCYSSLILTGQQGGDGGNGDLEGANEGYSGYVRLLFYLQEMSTDNFLMPSSSNGLRKCLNLQWDASNASVVTWTYQRLYMSIAYCNELLRECTEGKLQDRGLWEEMKDEYIGYRAEARFIRAYCYSMLCDLLPLVACAKPCWMSRQRADWLRNEISARRARSWLTRFLLSFTFRPLNKLKFTILYPKPITKSREAVSTS